jgi:hypothetical protein
LPTSAAGSDLKREADQAARLRAAFEIDEAEVVGGSYSDLMTAEQAEQRRVEADWDFRA